MRKAYFFYFQGTSRSGVLYIHDGTFCFFHQNKIVPPFHQTKKMRTATKKYLIVYGKIIKVAFFHQKRRMYIVINLLITKNKMKETWQAEA
jgi:hypothetical protein